MNEIMILCFTDTHLFFVFFESELGSSRFSCLLGLSLFLEFHDVGHKLRCEFFIHPGVNKGFSLSDDRLFKACVVSSSIDKLFAID